MLSLFFIVLNVQSKEIIILLHGLGRHASSMRHIQQSLQEIDLEVYSIDYNSRAQNLSTSINEVKESLAALNLPAKKKVSMIGHSLGGLIALKIMEDLKEEERGLCMTLGTPFYGSPVIKFLKKSFYIENFYGPVFEELAYFNADDFFLGIVHPFCLVGTRCPKHLNFFGWLFKDQDHDCLVGQPSASYKKAKAIVLMKTNHNFLLSEKETLDFILNTIKLERVTEEETQVSLLL